MDPDYASPVSAEKKTEYRPFHAAAAIIALVTGYLFIRWFVLPVQALAAFIFAEGFGLLSLAVLVSRSMSARKAPSFPACLLLAADIALPAVYLMAGEKDISLLVSAFLIFSYPLFYLLAFGSEDGRVGDGLFFDMIKAVFVMPFASFVSVFPALVSPLRGKKAGKLVCYVLLGIVIAFVPAAIVTALLTSADPAFSNMISDIIGTVFGNDLSEIILNIWLLIFSIPVSMYLFGMVFSNLEKRCPDVLSGENRKNLISRAAKIPVLVVCSAVVPLLVIYFLFFISQLGYFVSAFGNMVPEGCTAAEYARRGFFELCAVASINLAVTFLATALAKRSSEKPEMPIRVLNSVLSLFTLVLIATAMRKMLLYIGMYGFTPLRVMTSWFMILLALIFILVTVKQIKPAFNAVGISFAAAVVMFAVLCLSDLDARVVQANVWLYQTGRLETCDIDAFSDLSDSAMPYVIPLLSDSDPETAADARNLLEKRLSEMSGRDESWKVYSPGRHSAAEKIRAALDKSK